MDISSLIPAFGGFLGTAVAFVMALSVIVAVHEYGHYIVGRWGGIKAEVFSLGFGPVLFSRVDRHGTRWQVALLPFGGYVKFLGDADAASATKDGAAVEGLSPQAYRQTIQGAPLWARASMVAAGPVFNFILSIIIFAGIAMSAGVVKAPLTVGDMVPMPYDNPLREGDEIVSIAGLDVPDLETNSFVEYAESLPIAPTLDYVVRRDGQEITLRAPYPLSPIVQGLSPQSAAYDIEMKVGDVITAVDGAPLYAFDDLKEAVLSAEGKPLVLDVWRDGETLEFVLAPRRVDEPQPDGGFETTWRIGIVAGILFDPATEPPGFGQALMGGVWTVWEIARSSLSGLYHIITGAISTCNMSGPIGIAEVSGAMASQGTQNFIYFIGVLSTAVGLLNLFPIPVLDGGHLMFFGYEAVVGKPPSERALRVLMAFGLTLILSTMLFALSNDIFCP